MNITELKYSSILIAFISFYVAWQTPFEVGVDFDSHEVCTANTSAATCESQQTASNVGGGGGILGFSLCYIQHTPPITV